MLDAINIKLDVKEDEQFEYNPFKEPADLAIAKRHGKAKMVYKKRVKKDEEGNEIPDDGNNLDACICCGLPAGGTKIPLTAGLHELYHLGTGFALYFKFIKYSIGILVLIMLVTGVFNLVTNVMSGDCSVAHTTEEAYCIKGYILSFTIANKREREDYLFAQMGVNFATVVIVMFFFQYLRYQFRKTEIMAENANITPSDYTVVLNGIDPKMTKAEIEHRLEGFAKPEHPIKVVRIIKPRAITEYFEVKNQEKELHGPYEEMKKKAENMTPAEEKKFKRMESDMGKIKKKLEIMKNKEFDHTPVAYVTFETAHQADYIQKIFKRSLVQSVLRMFVSKFHCDTPDKFQASRIEVKRAPEPTDIMWQNLGASSRQKKIKSAITNLTTAVMILMTFGLIFLINWGQDKVGAAYGPKSIIVQVMSFIGSIVICVSNVVLSMTIDYLTRFEKHHTYTHFLQGVAQKLAVAQFVNTALSTLFAELILSDTQSHKEYMDGFQSINFYGTGGLLESIYWVFITNAFLTPILTIFDSAYFYKLFRRWRLRKATTAPMKQKDAQMLYEGNTMALPAKYATIIKVMLMTCLYAPAMPFALIYASIGLFFSYWADKWVLLRRNALPNALNDSLTDSMVEYLEWASCAFSVGNIMYVFSLRNEAGNIAVPIEASPLVWISLGVSLFHIIFPMELLNETLFPIKDDVTETKTFEEARLHFTTDYDFTNPLTKAESLKQHLIRMKNSKRQSGFFQKALNTNADGLFAGFGEMANLKTGPEEEFHLAGLDEYCNQNHHMIQGKPTQATSPGLDFLKNVNTGLAKMIPGINIDTLSAGQPNQEAGTPEKSSLLPLPEHLPGSKVPTYNNGDKFDFNHDGPLTDLAALNFIAPHFQKDLDDDNKSNHDSHHSGDIDPRDCVDEREVSAREFSINRTVFEK